MNRILLFTGLLVLSVAFTGCACCRTASHPTPAKESLVATEPGWTVVPVGDNL